MKIKSINFVIFLFVLSTFTVAQPDLNSLLNDSFNLGGEKLKETQLFTLETDIINYGTNGKRTGTTKLKLFLKCEPAEFNDYRYTCSKFMLDLNDTLQISVPSLENWSYKFSSENDLDEKGQVFGIDHSKFDNLIDNNGKIIPPDISYFVYNSFIDFHAFANVFAERTKEGKGIQDLKTIGQTIVHESAFSEPPVDLGSNINKGSFFKNGKITLSLMGISLVNESLCSIVNFDSGKSSFKVLMSPAPNMVIETNGSSHYKGNIFINNKTNWVEKIIMNEIVVAETKQPFPPNKVNATVERNSIIKNVNEELFENMNF